VRDQIVSRPFGVLVVVVFVLAAAILLREVGSLLVPLLFGGFIALVALPLVEALVRRKVRRPLALALTIFAVLVVLLGTLAIVAISIGELVVLVPTYEERLSGVIDSIQGWLLGFGIQADVEALRSIVRPEQIAGLIRPIAAAVSDAGLDFLVIVLTMSYALVGAPTIRGRLGRALGADHAFVRGVARFGADLRRYLVVRAQLGVFAAVLSFVLLFILSVPLPALWAFLVFAASFIPNLGVLLAVIPPTILTVLDNGLGAGLAVIAGYLAINFLQDNFLQPVVLGTELNLTPLVVFVAVVVWAWILGPAGALLAVPLTVGLVAILEAFPSTHQLAVLMRRRVDDHPFFSDEEPGPA